MKSDDVPQLEHQMAELDSVVQEMRGCVLRMAALMGDMVNTCDGEPELLGLMGTERRFLGQFRSMVEDLSITRRIRRRLPMVTARLREDERNHQDANETDQREATQIKQDFEDILRAFLRGS